MREEALEGCEGRGLGRDVREEAWEGCGWRPRRDVREEV